MRRALVTNEFAPSHGGVERLLYERSRGFQPESLTVFSAYTEDCEAFDAVQTFKSRRSGRLIGKIPFLKEIGRSIAPMVSCYREHKRSHFAVLECGQAFPACLFAWWLYRKQGTPYLVWVHGNDLLGPCRYRVLRNVIRKSLLQAHAIVVNSSWTAGIVEALGIPPENIRIIAPYVDTEKFQPAPPCPKLLQRYQISDQKVIVTVCRLVERKGVDLTLKAIAALLSRHPDIKYLIVGDGPKRRSLERLAQDLGLADQVIFTGLVAEAELVAHYNLASMFVMPSRFLSDDASVEGLGLVYLEAMACSVPVIAGRSGGVPDIVLDGKNGLLIDPGSLGELTAAIDTLITDAAYAKQLGLNGLAFVKQPRDWGCLAVCQT